MKKILIPLLAACMLMAAGAPAKAVDFKARGLYMLAFDYNYGGSFTGKDRQGKKLSGSRQQGPHYPMDEFAVWQRFLVGFDAVASDNLSASLLFEIGDQFWGQGKSGGALGADGVVIEVKNAYLDWTVPGAGIKLRMGLQGFALPGFSFRGSVLNDDMAAVTATYAFNGDVSATAFWARPYNDNYEAYSGGRRDPGGYMDNMDLFGLLLPVNFDGVKATPWFMVGAMGSNVTALSSTPGAGPGTRDLTTNPRLVNSQAPQEWAQFVNGMLPAVVSANETSFRNGYALAFWLGLTGEITAVEPWRLAWDVNYGSVKGEKSHLDRSGWLANLLLEYRAEWGAPGIYGWLTSGDDDNPRNGSEQMPYVSTVNVNTDSYSNFGFRGTPWFNNSGVLGGNPQGMWGIGARIRNMGFAIPDLKSTILVNYFGGTNDPKMASFILGRRVTDGAGRQAHRRWTDFTANPASGYGAYLTRNDSGIEINFNNLYKIYDNLTLLAEFGYIRLGLDQGTWGRSGGAAADNLSPQDAWKASLGLAYSF